MARKIDYSNLTADDLQYLADRQWLIVEGDYQGFKTSDAIKAWREDGTVPSEEQEGEGDGQTAGEIPEGEEEGIAYKDASVADLKAELEARNLPTDGKKAELIARLEENDLEEEEIEEDEEEESAD